MNLVTIIIIKKKEFRPSLHKMLCKYDFFNIKTNLNQCLVYCPLTNNNGCEIVIMAKGFSQK